MKLHTIVSDLDGTLLTRAHVMTPETVAGLVAAQEAGIRTILASGRSAASMRPYVEAIGAKFPYIACNGAQVMGPDGTPLRELALDVALVKELLTWLDGLGIYAQIYYGNAFYYDKECSYAEDYRKSSGCKGVCVEDLVAFADRPSPKVLAVMDPALVPEMILRAKERFPGRVTAITSEPQFLELSHPQANKGTALAALAEILGFEAEGTLAVGDSLNDLPMIQWAGLGVAVGNARQEVKDIAQMVVGEGPKEGVAQMIHRLLEEGARP